MTHHLTTIPPELILLIAHHLPTSSISHLLLCNRQLHSLLSHTLYRTHLSRTADQGHASLIHCAQNDNLGGLKRLLSYGADPHLDHDDQIPSHLLPYTPPNPTYKHLHAMNMTYSESLDGNYSPSDMMAINATESLLFPAARCGSIKVLRYLCLASAGPVLNPFCRNYGDQMPLEAAASFCQVRAMKVLLHAMHMYCANENYRYADCFNGDDGGGSEEMDEKYSDGISGVDSDLSIQMLEPSLTAAATGDCIDGVRILLEYRNADGAGGFIPSSSSPSDNKTNNDDDHDDTDTTWGPDTLGLALHIAVGNNSSPIVGLLLEHNADPDRSPGWYHPLLKAAKVGNADMVRLLLRSGVDPDILHQHGRVPTENALVAAANLAVLESGLYSAMGVGWDGAEGEDEWEEWEEWRTKCVAGAEESARVLVEAGADVDLARFLVESGKGDEADKKTLKEFLDAMEKEVKAGMRGNDNASCNGNGTAT